ncbi:Mce protein [Mycolicibacterium fortuitum]
MASTNNALKPDTAAQDQDAGEATGDTAHTRSEAEHSIGDDEPHPANQSPDHSVGVDDPDSDAPPPPDNNGPTGTWRRRPKKGWVAAFLSAALVVGAGYEGWMLYQQHVKTVATEQALQAARSYAATLTSIDTNAIDQNFTSVLEGATGEFKEMYAKSSGQLRQLLIDNKATAHGTVIDAAVKSANDNRVEVLLFVDQTVSNLAVPDPRIDRSRIRMTMQKVDDKWLASSVELP